MTGLAESPFILAGSTSLKGKSLRDIMAMAKESGASLSIGHGGNGTLMHLTAEMLNQMGGIKLNLVPYRGMAPVLNDLVGGHIALGIIDPPTGVAAIEAGTIAAIAISSSKRFFRLPDIPTFAEQGLPSFESNGWFGIVAPARTPPDVIARLNTAFITAMKDPATVDRIRRQTTARPEARAPAWRRRPRRRSGEDFVRAVKTQAGWVQASERARA